MCKLIKVHCICTHPSDDPANDWLSLTKCRCCIINYFIYSQMYLELPCVLLSKRHCEESNNESWCQNINVNSAHYVLSFFFLNTTSRVISLRRRGAERTAYRKQLNTTTEKAANTNTTNIKERKVERETRPPAPSREPSTLGSQLWKCSRGGKASTKRRRWQSICPSNATSETKRGGSTRTQEHLTGSPSECSMRAQQHLRGSPGWGSMRTQQHLRGSPSRGSTRTQQRLLEGEPKGLDAYSVAPA
jgi:hypothetical protein